MATLKFPKIFALFLYLSAFLLATACSSPIDQKVDNIDRNMKRLADEVEHDRQYAKSLAESLSSIKDLGVEAMTIVKAFLAQLAERKDPAKTPDVEDLIGETKIVTATLAPPLEVKDVRCVSKTVDRVHQTITDYAKYQVLDDKVSFFDPGVPGMAPIKLIDMVKSQPVSWEQLAKLGAKNNVTVVPPTDGATPKDTSFVVWVVMQPMNLGDGTIYPKFALDCRSRWDATGGFKHFCNTTDVLKQVDARFGQYGLKKFASDLTVTANSPACNGGTRLDYKLILETYPDHVQRIKRAVLGVFVFLAPVVDVLFDENTFFSNYYKEFYQAWVSSL